MRLGKLTHVSRSSLQPHAARHSAIQHCILIYRQALFRTSYLDRISSTAKMKLLLVSPMTAWFWYATRQSPLPKLASHGSRRGRVR